MCVLLLISTSKKEFSREFDGGLSAVEVTKEGRLVVAPWDDSIINQSSGFVLSASCSNNSV